MMPDKLSKRVVSDRLAWVETMLAEIRTLPGRYSPPPRGMGEGRGLRTHPPPLFSLAKHPIGAPAFGGGAGGNALSW